MARPPRSFRREALLLALALLAAESAFFFLSSGRGLRFFATEPVAELAGLAAGALGPDGELRLAAAGAEPTIAGLGAVDFAPGRTYVVTVRAGAGLEFGLQAIERDSQRPDWKGRIPRRAEAETFSLRLEARPRALSRRFEIWNTHRAPLEIRELRIQELRAAHDRIRAAIHPLELLLLVAFAARHRRILGDHFRSSQEAVPAVDRLIAFLLLLACFQVFTGAPAQQRIDAKYTSAVSYRVLTAGTVTLPPDFSAARAGERPYQLQEIDGRIVHTYPSAPAILNAPFVALFAALDLAPMGPDGVFLRHREHQILAFAAAVQAAALCALLYLLARIFLPPAWSLSLAGVFAFGTQIFSTVSRSYWSHSWALLLVTGGLYCLLVPRWRDRTRAYVASATLLSWSFFCRPPMSLSILALTAFVFFRRRRHFLPFATAGAVWAALFSLHSLAVYGRLVPAYFLSAYVETGTLGAESLSRVYPHALVATLLSRDRGLFVFVPFVVPLLFLLARYWRRLPHRDLALVALGASFAHWQVICTNKYWWGGGFGPRLLTDLLAWLYLLAILVVLAWRRDPGFGRAGRAVVAAATLLLVAASILVNARGANTRGRIHWDGYSIWDWRQPTFLGRVPPPAAPRTYADRVAELAAERDPDERLRLVDEIVRAESLAARPIAAGMTARAVTWDLWTYGDSPALVTVTNPAGEELVPRLALASWAPPEVYPLTVSVEDGESERRFTLAARGSVEVALSPVPAGSSRVYVVRSDKGWRPGGADDRQLGVQLRVAEGVDG